ncbi:unnamed protein product (macronuclear) [Paramecium tetraurelia]|uniref:Pinin/SDK/MemA protein domain-containing protein n=1 Tax=Paramecium tetraurelia TaxID=5888 RepID=A0ED16_PARTE|nr:uncharacterized protein GSPATT00004052001 [Paramecium tetraurelia]CAK93183.1 unnamed protein product [Paramecium tetraurelia]|eukprot:XP_001460580.1 hypothetical protein (macronuclear) [Paramecium tetraurelia strain d4-2]
MNADDLRNKLNELNKKQADILTKRKAIINEIRNFSFQKQDNKKVKLNNGKESNVFQINLVGAKEERAEKQKQLDEQVPTTLKEKDKRLAKFLLGNHLQKAKQDLMGEKQKLDKQIEINKRLDDKDKQDLQTLKEDQNRKKSSLVNERKQLEQELAADEYRRQVLLLELQIKIMRDFFITKTYPHILWQPAKTNEGMNPLKEYSTEKFNVKILILGAQEMEKDLKDQLLRAYTNFTESQYQKLKEQQVQQEHESSQSESEESQEKQKEEGQE